MAYKTGNIEPEQQAEIEDVIKRFHRTGDLSNFVHTMEEILLEVVRTQKRKCPICGEIFKPEHPNSKYCSPKCRLIARKRQYNEDFMPWVWIGL